MNGRMPLASRLLYASGSLGGNALGRTRDLWLIFFYLGDDDGDVERKGAAFAIGAVLVIGRLIEAFDDPLIGYWSDRTRTRWGRRIPFVLAATPFMAIFFVLLWIPPNPGETIGNVIWLFAIFWFFNLFSTLSGGPLESLLPEIARRNDDRLSIVGWQVAFGVVGTAIAFIGTGFLVDAFGFVAMAIIVAVVAVVSRYIALTGAWRRTIEASPQIYAEDEAVERLSVWKSITTCLQNDQFLVFLPSFILYSVGVQIITGVLPFYVESVLGRDEPGAMVGVLSACALGVLTLILPVAILLARRRSKREVYGWGMLFAGLYFPLFSIAGFLPGIPVVAQGITYALFIGIALAPVQTFPNALIADITDYDTVLSGQRREAVYYATQQTLEKIAGAAGPGILVALLALGSTADDPLGIRLVGPVAGILALAGYVVFRRYRLPDHVTEESVAAASAARQS
ncbi:MAG: MFS transporter [Chloroflexi bacterium]|nr:MFS transporter [Chloroflexota bacterium]